MSKSILKNVSELIEMFKPRMCHIAPCVAISVATWGVSLAAEPFSASSVSIQPTSADESGKLVAAKKSANRDTPPNRLEAAKQELIELRNQLKSEFQAIQRDASQQGSSRARRIPELDRLQKDLESRATDRETRVKRMLGQMSRLDDLLRDAPACQPEPLESKSVADRTPPLDRIQQRPDPPVEGPEHQTLPAAPELVEHDSPGTVHITTPVVTPSNSATTNLPNSLHDRLKADEHTTGPTDSATSVKEMITATTVTDHPIDRVGLANNLYGTGEIQLALDIYQKIPLAEQSPSDRLWIQYQMANCHRRLGNKNEAERGFRIVTSQDSKSWIGKFAVWWLNSNSKIETAQERLDELNRMSGILKEPVNANGNP